jgi:N-acetyl sugar amidotransferase
VAPSKRFHVKRCRTCVMVTTRPDSYFDETGECSACVAYRNRANIDWDARKQQLIEILDKAKGRCIVASSGGKDSHWIALTLLDLGAKVTVVTATTDHLTDIGKRNIANLARYADTIEVTPNQTVRRKISRIGLRTVGDISYGEHMAIWATPFQMAVKLNCPLVFYGENPQNDIAGPKGTGQEQIMTAAWVHEFGGFLGLRARDLVGQDGITEQDIQPYLLPNTYELGQFEAYFLGAFLPWDGRSNAEVARERGFEWYFRDVECSIGRFESLDNGQTGIHEWYKMLKYAFSRPTDLASHAIRRGRMTREQALTIVKDAETFPWTYIGISYLEVLEQIGITQKEFVDICHKFLNRSLFLDTPEAWHDPKLLVSKKSSQHDSAEPLRLLRT